MPEENSPRNKALALVEVDTTSPVDELNPRAGSPLRSRSPTRPGSRSLGSLEERFTVSRSRRSPPAVHTALRPFDVIALKTPAVWVSVATVWLENTEAISCMSDSCRETFGLFERRHHCRSCGLIFCDQCCPLTGLPGGW